MDEWVVGVGANGIIALGYLTIAGLILTRIGPLREWWQNPLALATGLIFLTAGLGRSLRIFQLLGWPLSTDAVTEAAREHYDAALTGWDLVTGAVAVWYVLLRRRFPTLAPGSTLYDDVRVRQGQALELHDNVVQGMTSAKLAFELGHTDQGLDILERTLTSSRSLVTELMGEENDELSPMDPGDLRRDTPGGVR